MSGNFEADLNTMAGAGRHVREVNEQIQATLNSLLDRLEPLTTGWKGSAATSFQELKERWHRDATQLNGALAAIGERLERAHATYAAKESEVGRTISTITGRLGG
jgi:WXG100 family type VII secretion target